MTSTREIDWFSIDQSQALIRECVNQREPLSLWLHMPKWCCQTRQILLANYALILLRHEFSDYNLSLHFRSSHDVKETTSMAHATVATQVAGQMFPGHAMLAMLRENTPLHPREEERDLQRGLNYGKSIVFVHNYGKVT